MWKLRYNIQYSLKFKPINLTGFEISGPSSRVMTGMLIELVWCVGEYLTVFVAYFVRDWRTLQVIFAAPIGIFLIYWKQV
jgi:hypothetical protein